MRTPAGTECRYYFEDYFRGRERRECRLLPAASAHEWRPELCGRCPVPRILLANACPNLVLAAGVRTTWLGLGRRMEITARCRKSGDAVREPEIGCGQCHLEFEKMRLGPDSHP
ncbi:MAG TPA: hypothetical protein VJJ70_04910 [Anaerolineales bacterium]|nr:hypothetical protein [Anaerolineales bacterium]